MPFIIALGWAWFAFICKFIAAFLICYMFSWFYEFSFELFAASYWFVPSLINALNKIFDACSFDICTTAMFFSFGQNWSFNNNILVCGVGGAVASGDEMKQEK